MADITAGWNINMPSGTSRKSDGDDLMRQHWRSLDSTISTEHYMSDSVTSAGMHKKGSARVYVQASAPATSLDRDGRLWLESGTSRLHFLHSSLTQAIAGAAYETPIVISKSSGVPADDAQLVQVVIKKTYTASSINNPSFGLIFDNAPMVQITPDQGGGGASARSLHATIDVMTTSSVSFQVIAQPGGARAPTFEAHILATGWVSNFS